MERSKVIVGFIKVLNCYNSAIDAYYNRYLDDKITGIGEGDDVFAGQMKTCRAMRNNWIKNLGPMTLYEHEEVDGYNSLLMELVSTRYKQVVNEVTFGTDNNVNLIVE